MSVLSKYALAYLTQCQYISRKKRKILRDRYGSLLDMKKDISWIFRKQNIDSEFIPSFREILDSWDEEGFKKYLDSNDISIVDIRDSEYPELLREIHSPPLLLFCKGNTELLSMKSVSIVGTRKPTNYGRDASEIVVREISVPVFVSGGAYGIDQLIHENAVKQDKFTIIVLGMGLERVQSNIANNKLLADHADLVLLVSEYWPTTDATKFTFPERNRIISGFSRATIVVEAPRRSGSLITAQFALDQNREVIAVPGPIFHEQSTGTNKLISEGAIPYSREILEQIYPPRDMISSDEVVLLDDLAEPKYAEEISRNHNILTLSMLEIRGLVQKMPDGRWVKK